MVEVERDPPADGDVALTIAQHGSARGAAGVMLGLTFANRSPRQLAVLAMWRTSDEPHFDHLAIDLVPAHGGAWLHLVPTGPRKAVEPVCCLIGPDASLTLPFPLSAWLRRLAVRPAPAEYRVTVTYDASTRAFGVYRSDTCPPPAGADAQPPPREGTVLACVPGPIRSNPLLIRLAAG